MPTTISLQPDHAYVLLSVFGMFLTAQMLGARVNAARAKHGVKLPSLYATPGHFLTKDGHIDQKAWEEHGVEFNKVQRGHQHIFEHHADAYALMLACGLFYPAYSAQAAGLYMVGQIVYAFGYSIKPGYRVFGEALYLPAFLAWIYGIYSAGTAIYAGKPIV